MAFNQSRVLTRKPHNSFNRSGMSAAVIENLNADDNLFGRVNTCVRRLPDGGFIELNSVWRIALHVAVWSGVFLFWLLVTRGHHPTLAIALSATAVLVSSFVLAVYANSLLLWPVFAQRRLWLRYGVSVLATVLMLDLVAVLLIQFIYDRLWGADPLRYGFWFNMASDGIGIAVHLAAAMLLMWVGAFLRGRASKQPGAP